jgi:predicted metal-dependent hydrolase
VTIKNSIILTKSPFKRKAYHSKTLDFHGLKVNVQHKKIKKLYLKISNKNGDVNLCVPLNISENFIVNFVTEKLQWIKDNQQKIHHKKKSLNIEYVESDNIKFLGEIYQIKLIQTSKKPQVNLIKNQNLRNKTYQENSQLNLFNCPESQQNSHCNQIIFDSIEDLTKIQKIKLLEKFYRQNLQEILQELAKKWQKILQIEANFIGIKKMRTRYGSCNARRKNIWISLNLIHYPIECIEYVLLHEFLHFFEQNHGKKFYALMNKFMPNWQDYQKILRTT